MTIGIQSQHRCRICFSLIQRDRSLAYQKSFHLFKHFERRKFQLKTRFHSCMKFRRNATVCFGDLIDRYLHVQITPQTDSSNIICSDCSMILLDIEQCAKYLRKTIQQLKIKLNKSNQLRTSSLSVRLQRKKQGKEILKEEYIPIESLESDNEFEDDEEIDEEQDEIKPSVSSNFIPSSSDGESFSNIQTPIKTSSTKIHPCNNNDDADDDDDDEIGLIKSSPNFYHAKNSLSTSNGLVPTSNLLEESTNSNLFQLHLAQLMSSTMNPNTHYSDSNNNNNNNNQSMMNTLANMQKNFFMQFFNEPAVVAQAVTSTPMKSNLMSTNNKQMSSGRKRKSTPEKRAISNHSLSTTNNGDVSPTVEHDLSDPLELTTKNSYGNNRVLTSSSSNIQNLMTNDSPINSQMFDENKESLPLNEFSLSPSLIRRPTSTKRAKTSSDYPQKLKIHISSTSSPSSTHLLSPNHQLTSSDLQQQKQQKTLDPRPCAECGKILFNNKTHLLHCQTHAINEKQCWICGLQDDDVKKHILNEHGNQRFTNAGFKCEHCEKIFPAYADLQSHMRDHNKKKPFECSICHKRFGQQGNLSCHLRIHSGVKPFTCAHCGKAFRHSNSLRRHARTVHSASRELTLSTNSTGSSLLATTSNSMVSMANDYHETDGFDDQTERLIITSDDGESIQSTTDLPSPSISNAQNDSDSHEQYGTS